MTASQEQKGEDSKKQAQQLDQLTDHVQERDMNIDASKAAQMMTTLQSSHDGNQVSGNESVIISKEDVKVIVDELEVTDEVATEALKNVMLTEGDQPPRVRALRYLLTS